MSVEVKLRRGDTADHSTFTGLEGEVTVDTDDYRLVVHDGVTAGGYPLALLSEAGGGGGLTEYTSATNLVPGSIYFAEDTDNGTNKITITAPATIASDKTVTLQDVTGTMYVSGGTDVALADGGTGASLADPGADRIMFWDDTAGAVTWLNPAGNGLVIIGTDLYCESATTTADGIVELATDAETITGTDTARAITPSNLTGASIYGYMPQNSQSTAYTLVAADQSKHILHPTADNNARTFTIPANATVAFPIGTTVTFINQINTVTISITSDTLTLAGTGSTGSRTLAANGIATAIKVGTTSWVISGTGLT